MIPDYIVNADRAIALSYDEQTAPKLVASGESELADAIIQLALDNKVPIYQNAELVNWLSQLDIGDEIPEALYQIIAEILAFVYLIEGRAPHVNE